MQTVVVVRSVSDGGPENGFQQEWPHSAVHGPQATCVGRCVHSGRRLGSCRYALRWTAQHRARSSVTHRCVPAISPLCCRGVCLRIMDIRVRRVSHRTRPACPSMARADACRELVARGGENASRSLEGRWYCWFGVSCAICALFVVRAGTRSSPPIRATGSSASSKVSQTWRCCWPASLAWNTPRRLQSIAVFVASAAPCDAPEVDTVAHTPYRGCGGFRRLLHRS